MRIFIIGILLYLTLVFPISMVMLFKYGPEWMESSKLDFIEISDGETIRKSIPDSIPTLDTSSNKDKEFTAKRDVQTLNSPLITSVELLIRSLLFSLLLAFIWNYPFKKYFRLKRKNATPSPALQNFCEKWILRTPWINSTLFGWAFVISLSYLGYHVFYVDAMDEMSHRFGIQYFFISFFAAFLAIFFMYFWFRHRVRFKYIDYIFSNLSLYKPRTNRSGNRLIVRLWINNAMTTLLPLIIVAFYMTLSTSSIKSAVEGELNDDQIQVLFARYIPFIEQADIFQNEHLFYVNAIDSLLMFFGIFAGIVISILYLLFFVNWTNQSIIGPVEEILKKMKETDSGALDRLTIVRSNDELGTLAIGYNEMATRISDNFNHLQQITNANQRFVPKEFLEILGKKSITDVHLGDQIQKHMTVLFVDIRSFTAHSESMTPKENFDFLNQYLSFMEPNIRKHGGFIDKFIGDSIMALFDNNPENALNAALEMHDCLIDFNRERIAAGKLPIETGAGIHTGNLMLGVVGGSQRVETTVISDAVNLASRLEGLTRTFEAFLIISENTFNLLANKDMYQHISLGEVSVKGRIKPVHIISIKGKSKNIETAFS